MTIFEVISAILVPLLAFSSFALLQALGREKMVSSELALSVLRLKVNESALIASLNNKPKSPIQETTRKLLILATQSNVENEAAAAAKQACKRVAKELGIK